MNKKYLDNSQFFDYLKDQIEKSSDSDEINALMIFSSGKQTIDPSQMNQLLQSSAIPILGGIFPEVIFQGQSYSEGSIVVSMKQNFKSVVLDDFSSSEAIEHKLIEAFGSLNPTGKTVFIYADALLDKKIMVFEELYNLFGTLPRYIGGGAGTLEFNSFPCLYTNQGLKEGSIVIGICELDTTIGVAHGWESISEPLKVTSVEGNKIISLNWQPAMQVYQKIVEEHSGKKFDYDHFFDTTKSYPFGVSKLDSEKIVRDPYMTENDNIYTLDTIEAGSHVSVLFGNKDSLLKGAQSARKRAENDKEIKDLLLIDCISRVLYMGTDFSEELLEIDPNKIGFGALTLGEIANNGDSFLEVYNKTAVVCTIHDD